MEENVDCHSLDDLEYKNNIFFNNSKVDVIKMFCMAQLCAWVWMTHKIPIIMFSYKDWV